MDERDGTTRNHIRQFILERFPSARKRNLSDGDPLLQNGLIDSMGILEVVEFLESKFGVQFSDDELLPENFESISRLTAFVEEKQSLRSA
jgi:acyl carrier protein